MVEYEVSFHLLIRHATMILHIEYKRIWYFLKELGLLLYRATKTLVTSGKSSTDIVDYAYTI